MIKRRIHNEIKKRLSEVPAVALLGPRQVGKTTLALEISKDMKAIYLDLESEQDRAKLIEPELYLTDHLDKLVILDEIHRVPGLFPILRGLIDRARREGKQTGLYLLLGSASPELLRQSGETLAGRISYLELHPFDIFEIKEHTVAAAQDVLWLRGGFPDSYLAAGEQQSLRWRQDFIRTYLERDIPQLGRRVVADMFHRFWVMLAHHQGGVLNTSQLARNLDLDVKTVSSYIELLTDLFLVRRLTPWFVNGKKRLVKSPKVYIRDSGIVHALLSITDKESLLSNPVVGSDWEGFIIENILNVTPEGVRGYFYRTSGGAEIDLLLSFANEELWAVEVKRSLTPQPRRGFHSACEDLAPTRRFVVYPGNETYPMSKDILAIPLIGLIDLMLGPKD